MPNGDPRFDNVLSLSDVAGHWLREIENFFATYKRLQDVQTELQGWDDREAAWEIIGGAREHYRRSMDFPSYTHGSPAK